MSNYEYVSNKSDQLKKKATKFDLMYSHIQGRKNVNIDIANKRNVNFANCSYLGLDTLPSAIQKGSEIINDYGINFCTARTRLSGILKVYFLIFYSERIWMKK